MAVTTPSIWYANFGNGSSTGYFAVTTWATGFTPTAGTLRRQTAPTAANERVFVCVVSGAVGGAEPSWVVTKGAKTTDGSATWMECTGQPALNGDLASTPLSSQNRSGAQVLGNIITNNTQSHYFICTTAGTTGAGEPTYTTTTGGTTTDSGCTWTCLGAVGSFTAWMAPFSRLATAGANSLARVPDGGTLYVSAAHAETAAANTTTFSGGGVNAAQTQVICVANACSFPPVAADITTGASVTVTGATAITIPGGNVEFNGFTFVGGTASTSISISTSNTFVRLRNCAVSTPSTAGRITIGSGATEWINTTVAFGNNAGGQGLGISGHFVWRDTPTALSTTTVWPTNLFGASSSGNGVVLVEGVDLSAFAGTQIIPNLNTYFQRVVFSHCKLPSTTIVNSLAPSVNGYVVDLVNCDTGGATYNTQRAGLDCLVQTSAAAVVTGGASDGTTPFSWSFTAGGTSALTWTNAFESAPIMVWNATTGANVTVTLEGAWVGSALPYNDDIWLEVLYFGTASSARGSRAKGTKATVLSANTQWSSSSALWGGSAPARQNSHAYARGDLIGVSSSGGVVRLFVCTTAGTSNGSLPGGYATAVDGSTVADGGSSCVFTAVLRFTMTVTLSAPQPQAAGYLYCYIKLANNGSGSGNYQTCFVDPKITLS